MRQLLLLPGACCANNNCEHQRYGIKPPESGVVSCEIAFAYHHVIRVGSVVLKLKSAQGQGFQLWSAGSAGTEVWEAVRSAPQRTALACSARNTHIRHRKYTSEQMSIDDQGLLLKYRIVQCRHRAVSVK